MSKANTLLLYETLPIIVRTTMLDCCTHPNEELRVKLS